MKTLVALLLSVLSVTAQPALRSVGYTDAARVVIDKINSNTLAVTGLAMATNWGTTNVSYPTNYIIVIHRRGATNGSVLQPIEDFLSTLTNLAGWPIGSGGSATNAQPPSTVLTNISNTGVSPGATNASAYIGSSLGTGTNVTLSGNVTNTSTNAVALLGPTIQRDTGGDARGHQAVDFQNTRAAASQVAAGAFSALLGGQNNLVGSGALNGVVIGGQNQGSAFGATNGFIFGGEGNLGPDTPTRNSGIVGGRYNDMMADISLSGFMPWNSLILGGETNQLDQSRNSIIFGGSWNVIGNQLHENPTTNSYVQGSRSTVMSSYASTIGTDNSIESNANYSILIGHQLTNANGTWRNVKIGFRDKAVNIASNGLLSAQEVRLLAVQNPSVPAYIDADGDIVGATGTADGSKVLFDDGILGPVSNKVVVTAGANITVTPSGSGGVMTYQVATSGGVGESNVNGESSVTNNAAGRFGLVNGKSGITNLLRSISAANGLVGTNQGTNVALAIDPSIVASQANLTSASNSLISEIITASNNVYTTETTRNAAVSNAVVSLVNQRQWGDAVLSNLVGTVGQNVTNADETQFSIASGKLTGIASAMWTNLNIHGLTNRGESTFTGNVTNNGLSQFNERIRQLGDQSAWLGTIRGNTADITNRIYTQLYQGGAFSNINLTVGDNLHINGTNEVWQYTASTNASLVLTNLSLNTPVDLEVYPTIGSAGWALTLNIPAASWPGSNAWVFQTNGGLHKLRVEKKSSTQTNVTIVEWPSFDIVATSPLQISTNVASKQININLATGTLSNLNASSIGIPVANVVSNVGGLKWGIWTNYVQTVSNFVFSFNTNYVELKNQTNIVFTNIVEEATAVGANMSVHVHNTTGVTMGLVWPAYGAQHGYYFQTNANNAILASTSLASGRHGVASFTAYGTNIFATWTEWP